MTRDGATGVMIEGAAGFGKTALMRHVAAALPDFAILQVSCDPAEASTPFAVYLQLLHQAGAARLSLPRPLPDVDPAAEAGAALLRHLEARPATASAIVAVDDAQWIDKASAAALGFVLRRLRVPPVVFVVCLRTSPDGTSPALAVFRRTLLDRPRSLRVRVAGLSADDIEALARGSGLDVGRVVAERIREQTGGSPRHVRAILSEVPPERIIDPGRGLPVPDSIRVEMAETLEDLSEGSRRLVEALAVLGETTPLVAAGRIGSVDDPVAALEPLLARELVTWWPEDPVTPVRVRTGAYRSAIYQAITPRRRHALHRAAAGDGIGDLWLHRVAAADTADRDLAGELAGAAQESSRRGDLEGAARLMLWAVSLSTDRPGSERRLARAARYLLRAHKDEQLAALLPRLRACGPDPACDLMMGLSAYMHGRLTAAESLLRSVRATVPADPELDELPVELWLAAIYARQDRPEAEAEMARLALGDGRDPLATSWANYFLADATGRVHGVAAALGELAQHPIDTSTATRPLRWARGIWQVLSGAPAAAIDDLRSAAAGFDDTDGSALGLTASAALAYAHYSLGAWGAATTAADNAVRRARARGRSWQMAPVHAVATCIAAGRGDWDRARQHLDDTEQSYELIGLESWRIYPAFAAAALAQAAADYPAMLRAVNQLADASHPTSEARYFEAWWRPLHIEALLGTQQLSPAAESLRELGRLAEDVRQLDVVFDWLSGWLAHRNGDERTAQARFDEGLARPVTFDDMPMYRARLNETYAQLLLDQHNRRGAVACLREAQDTYLLLRAQPFLERCGELLRACGLEPVESPSGPSLSALSRRELRVAHLVSAGLTNKETAKELFVSPKTVEYHLGNIFLKLGLGSRRELRALIQALARPSS